MGQIFSKWQKYIPAVTQNWSVVPAIVSDALDSLTARGNFGDGSDGNVTISSGVTTLTRDMFYANLTLSGTGQINMSGYRIFVSNILDISAATAGAISSNGGTGANATTQVGGIAGTSPPSNTVGTSGAASAGASGTTTSGAQAVASTTAMNGGASNASGASGASGVGGGSAGRAGTATSSILPVRRFETNLLRGIVLITSGVGGPGGSGGAGDNVTIANSCGGGGGGAGGGIVAIYANIINRGASTAIGAIQALGGRGGNGRSGLGAYTFTVTAGNTASVGDVYTHNGNTYIVTAPLLTAGTILATQGLRTPLTSGSLVFSSGSGTGPIAFSSVTATSSAAANSASIGGGGGASGGGGGWIYIAYNTLTGATATNALDASGGGGGVGGNGANNTTFTVTAGNTASVGATYTIGGETYTVTTVLLVTDTTLVTVGGVAPAASGSLTKGIGTGTGPITYSAFVRGSTFNTGAGGGAGGNGGRVTLLKVNTSTGSDTITGTGTAATAPNNYIGTGPGVIGVNRVSL